jgi:mRNA-degrading endonuclease toxin of MazEF toxin-antitoxin module
MKRGEIYFVEIPQYTGHEMAKNRPAVVLSAGPILSKERAVLVAFCSASYKEDTPYRVTIRSTMKPSTVMCEHIYAVDLSRVRYYIGECTPAEMQQIDLALECSLGLNFGYPAQACEESAEDEQYAEPDDTCSCDGADRALAAVTAERDTYKAMYEQLLDRLLGGRASV